MLDGFPPDTRIVIADVTWDDYQRLADAVREGEHCRIAFDQAPEFWRARKKSVSIEHLGPHGKYVPADRSRFLPVRSEDVTRWVYREDSTSRVNWEYLVREWARDLK